MRIKFLVTDLKETEGRNDCAGWVQQQLNQQTNMTILWCNCPMQELLKFRNLEERDCATVVERYRILPPLPSPNFPTHHALLGYAVNTGSRDSKEGPRDLRDVTHNNTQRCVLRVSDSSIYRRDWWQFSWGVVRVAVAVVGVQVRISVHIIKFAVSSEVTSWLEVRVSDWKTFFVCYTWRDLKH
jgi:hypothetical protein